MRLRSGVAGFPCANSRAASRTYSGGDAQLRRNVLDLFQFKRIIAGVRVVLLQLGRTLDEGADFFLAVTPSYQTSLDGSMMLEDIYCDAEVRLSAREMIGSLL